MVSGPCWTRWIEEGPQDSAKEKSPHQGASPQEFGFCKAIPGMTDGMTGTQWVSPKRSCCGHPVQGLGGSCHAALGFVRGTESVEGETASGIPGIQGSQRGPLTL